MKLYNQGFFPTIYGFLQSVQRQSLLLLAIIFLLHSSAFSQVRNYRGSVTDATTGQPVEGASVVITGKAGGTTTDEKGIFNIQASSGDVVEIGSVGFISQAITLGADANVEVRLAQGSDELEDVVVIGYGTTRKKDLTGAVTQVNAKELTRLPAANLGQALQGNVPGLWTNQSDRSPGAGVNIALRGSNSFSGNAPLFIVDGFPIASGGGVNAINPNDIESVTILKDASSTAIYGARAANGVILITTKSGKTDRSGFEVNVYNGFKSFANPIDYVSGEQLATIRREAYANDNVNGGVAVFRPEEEAMLNSGKATNWFDEVTGAGRPTQNIQVAFNGGSKNTKVFVSGNLFNEKGIINNSDFMRGSLRANIIQKLGKLTINSNTNLALLTGRGVSGPSILYPATIGNPLAPIRQENGDYYTMLLGVGNTPWANPKAYTEMIKSRYMEPVINSSMSLEYAILPSLKIKTQLAGELDSWKDNFYVPRQLSANHEESGRVSGGFASVTNNVNYNWISETTISFNETFNGIHQVNAVAGFSAQQNRWESVSASASDFPFDLYESWNLGASAGEARKPSSNLQEWTMNSYIGRVIYTFNDKYIVTGNFRADGSSRFGANNKWGFFPSAAVAWKLSEEDFIRGLDIFDDLKFRASYGLAGNANALGIYSTQARMSPASFNWGGMEAPGYYPSQLAYDNLKWETTKQLDLGIDAGFFNNRLNVSVDYYRKNTYDILRQLPILAVSGFTTGWANLGDMKNSGLEMTLKGLVMDKRVKWNAALLLAGNRNELTSLGDGSTQIGTSHWVGQPLGIGARYMLEMTGIWQEKDAAEAASYNVRPGDVRYRDLNNDGKIDNNDRAFHGNLTPTFYGSLNNDIQYGNFDMNVFLTFEKGRTVYNGLNYKLLAGDGYDNHRVEIMERWTPSNPSNKYPRAALGYSNRSSMNSTEFLEDADFIKLKNVTIGYTFPKFFQDKIGSSNVRVYLSGVNLLTFTKFTGMDPEDGDYGNTSRAAPYPITRTVLVGLNLKF